MSILTIALSDLRRLCGLDAGDTSQDTDLAAVRDAEQAALEYVIDPDTLADTGSVRAVLVLGVGEQIAGSYLQRLARAPLPLGPLSVGPLKLSAPTSAEWRALGLDLVTAGTLRLAPFTRSGVAAATAAASAALLASAKVATAQAQAADAAALSDARKAIAQGQAAKFVAEDASQNAALIAAPAALEDCGQ